MDSFRTFIAIELPPELRTRVAQHIDRLRRELPDVRASWLREDNLHLTLKFLGNVPVADIPKVSGAVERATQTIAPFELIVLGCGSFPPHGRPSVLWLGVGSAGILPASSLDTSIADFSPSTNLNPQCEISQRPKPHTQRPALSALHFSLENELAVAGFPRESRPFHPHLTIARLRNPQGARRLAELHKSYDFEPQTFTVLEVVVFRSELLKEGSKHTAISRHALR